LPATLANKRIKAMKDITIQTDEEILSLEICDEVLEAAARPAKDKTGNVTLAFCSGLDTCPGKPL
jgi:hypothetical protein